MKVRALLVATVVIAMLWLIVPCAQARDDDSLITTQGSATLFFEPDQVRLTLGVETRAQTAAEAMKKNADAMQKVVAAVKKKLTEKDNISTSGIRLSPVYNWDQKQKKQIFQGFTAVNQVRVTSGETENVGALLDVSVGAGVNNIDGPHWSLRDNAKALSKAQVGAFKNARSQALALADAASRELGEVESISTIGTTTLPRPSFNMPQLRMAASDQTPVLPGRIEVRADVTCVFELR